MFTPTYELRKHNIGWLTFHKLEKIHSKQKHIKHMAHKKDKFEQKRCPLRLNKMFYVYQINRSSHSQMFFNICVHKNFAISTGKHLRWNLFLKNMNLEYQ